MGFGYFNADFLDYSALLSNCYQFIYTFFLIDENTKYFMFTLVGKYLFCVSADSVNVVNLRIIYFYTDIMFFEHAITT